MTTNSINAVKESSLTVRWFYLAVGVVSMTFAGIIYAWSILKTPFGDAFGWSASQLALNYTLTMCFFCIGGVVSGILTKKTSPRVTLLAAAALTSAGFFLVSQLDGQIWMLYLSYGFMCGLGIGMAYNAVIAATNAWFPDKKGFCSGALMMGFGASALVLGSAAGAMIGSDTVGWRNTYMILGALMGAVMLISALVVRFPGDTVVLPEKEKKADRKSEQSFEVKNYTTAEMLRRPTFWRFFLYTITLYATGSTVISFARDLSISVGASIALATSLVGVLSVCNGLGRIFCGITFDNLGRRKTMLIASGIAILASLVLLIAVLNNSIATCIVGLCLTGIAYGCSPTISAALIGTFYGTKHFGMNFSISIMALIPAAFTATLASELVGSTGNYVTPFMMLIALSVLGLLLNVSIRQP